MEQYQPNLPVGESPVKSTAVVKYSAVQCPATFARLQCNTDLNLPPSNWLSSSAESYGLQHVPPHSTGFSSFRLAHMFPDCVGQVDVVSDAENIKKLLKIPYSKGPVSMMVHRVENTLLIDEFDIHKHLLHQAKTDWEWLREFLLTNVLQTMSVKENGPFRSHRRSALQHRLLVSKFLHHSLMAGNPPPAPPRLAPSTQLPVSHSEPPLPEPQMDQELPDPNSKHTFLRNVVWTFEDIQMLIGTDMPIFGGNTHPCLSLRLCDMAKPISVLTGIDYWLDNLMSNVPEVVMCFHLDGIVQRYELVKTEDLPHLDGSKFSAKVIRDVAQNILSFLKTNAAKAGHTYWLFKGKDDDVVKLYDLTSLCSGSLDEKGQNPFTVPVAMLLYRVARNMKHSPDSRHQRGTIRVLLDNCIRLLDPQKYPQIVTSAHYMLSDLYLPATIDPAAPVLDDELSEGEGETEQDGNKQPGRSRASSLSKNRRTVDPHSPRRQSCEGSVRTASSEAEMEVSETGGGEDERRKALGLSAIKSLHVKKMITDPSDDVEDAESSRFVKPPPLVANVEERCLSALKHVASGLQCLQFFGQPGKEDGKNEDSVPKFEEEPQMAKPFEPIPMPYGTLKPESSQPPNLAAEVPSGKKVKNSKNSKNYKATDEKMKHQQPGKSEMGKIEPTESSGIKKLLCPLPAGFMPTWQTPDMDDNVSWNAHLKTLLYEKACLVYATLAEQAYASEKYGLALRTIARVLRCREVLDRLLGPRPLAALASYLLGRAGDCCFMLVQRWSHVDQHRNDLRTNSSVDAEIEHEMVRDCPEMRSLDLKLVPETVESMEQLLLASFQCYERALALDPHQDNLYRRIGNAHNELGVLYMGQAAGRYHEIVQMQVENKEEDQTRATTIFKELIAKSLEHLEAGVRAFETVRDAANLALLHSNSGRLYRLCAHFHAPSMADGREVLTKERQFYNKALSSYQKALQVLGNRKNNIAIWDTVTWELSTALFNLATLSQDRPGPNIRSQEDAERTAVELLQRALKYCDLETPGPRQPVYQFRAASIHHRLASLYHKSYRSLPGGEDSRHARGVLQSCRLHYEKASELLALLEHPVEYFTVQLERVALAELQAQNATTVTSKLRALQSALDLLMATRPVLETVAGRPASVARTAEMDKQKVASDTAKTVPLDAVSEDDDDKQEIKLLTLLEQRLQFVLLTAAKISSTGRKELETATSLYKTLYSLCLRAPGSIPLSARDSAPALAKHLVNTISLLQSRMEENSNCISVRSIK